MDRRIEILNKIRNKNKHINDDGSFYYDYSNTNFIDCKSKTKLEIICPKHGKFEQRLDNHIFGKGCIKCGKINGGIKGSKTKSHTQKDFINKIIEKDIHINTDGSLFYEYFDDYVHSYIKIKILCKFHGIFYQQPNIHLKGQGCPKCGMLSNRLTNNEFLEKARKIYFDEHEYPDKYEHSTIPLRIICKKHGEFKQTPNSYLSGHGCQKCSSKGWTISDWINNANKSKHFDSFKLYIIKITENNSNICYYKIGITYTTLIKRFQKSIYNPLFNYEIIKIIENSDGRFIYNLETKLHEINHKNLYLPEINFGGKHECFSELSLEIFNYLKSINL